MSKSANTLLALLTGAAIGAGVGLLYAPDKGSKTRKKLRDEADKAKGKLDKQWKQTSKNLTDSAQKAKYNFEAKLNDTLSSASHKADDVLLAMEQKLEELRQKNAKFHTKAATEEVKSKVKKTTA
ncbi:YtxH domain-containing protein [Mesonia sp. K7]|uniref:YtxH domain-containing protein n=1 Tax=Mesonia sp. K7 TaxID=2218606 RepID=UPI000DAAC0AC|nr:YtxH domain-containing protein [Mesonia sp. K7]PZD79137.1 YtxH domain-containing protein [Mesonia sp. K7]